MRVLSAFVLAACLLTQPVSAAEGDFREVTFPEASEDAAALSKTYPFMATPLGEFSKALGEAGTEPNYLTEKQDFPAAKKGIAFLRLEDSFNCGAATGCASLIFVDDGKGFTFSYGTQINGSVYGGLCGTTPAVIVQNFDGPVESFQLLTYQGGELKQAGVMKTLAEARSCTAKSN